MKTSLDRGYILLEAMITIVILVIGLLGLAGFQTRATLAESEGYQRVQALLIAQDMVDRLYANRTAAASYIQDDIGSAGTVITACPGASIEEKDVCDWNNLIVGASEKISGVGVGTILGGRGCITAGAAANEYLIIVVWQGLVPTIAPQQACGLGMYGNDALRRAVTMRVVISTLSVV